MGSAAHLGFDQTDLLINQRVAAIFGKFTTTTTILHFAITFSTSRNSIDPKKGEEEHENGFVFVVPYPFSSLPSGLLIHSPSAEFSRRNSDNSINDGQECETI